MYDVIVIGGGAAGFFAAITAKETCKDSKILILEKRKNVLTKVGISGGGRCNVTHACFDSLILAQSYPRGAKELIGPLHHFQPKDIIWWFESKGICLKTESDGRVFPVSNSSQSIIDCLLQETKQLGIDVWTQEKVMLEKKENSFFLYNNRHRLQAKSILLATGSSPEGYQWAKQLGHTIEDLVPSLFTFNVPESNLKDLSGITLEEVELKVEKSVVKGPLLITHFGFSGPAVIKLSAFEAKTLAQKKYQSLLSINWLCHQSRDQTLEMLKKNQLMYPQKTLYLTNLFSFPKNLWKRFLEILGLQFLKKNGELSYKDFFILTEKMHYDIYPINGKTTYKEEFVTCGGVTLSEVNFKTMESKLCPHLFFAGEILNIDGLTGGFNLQNAWTTGYLAGKAMAF